jgi:hypothetical protein
MAQNEAQAGVRTAMGQELSDLARLSATEESRLRDVRAQINLEEAAGAQMAARDAQEARAAAIAQGFESVQGLAQTPIQAAPLYSRNIGAEKAAASTVEMNSEQMKEFGDVKFGMGPSTSEADLAKGFTNVDFSTIGQMSNLEYRKFVRNLSPEQRRMLFQNSNYQQNYNPFNPF